ncbi:MAG: site-specific integrase [Gammaproteobacteria bacterium]|nr:site-specific integrase [Gammaproteobacteria bacterium]
MNPLGLRGVKRRQRGIKNAPVGAATPTRPVTTTGIGVQQWQRSARYRVGGAPSIELQALLQACRESKSPELYPAVLLSVTTGARQGEIMGMRWECVDFKHKLVHVPKTRNGDARTLPIVDEALRLLKERRETDGTVKLMRSCKPRSAVASSFLSAALAACGLRPAARCTARPKRR